ncbi:MAG: alkaline phosphatase D family protein [Luteolibacter sp.]
MIEFYSDAMGKPKHTQLKSAILAPVSPEDASPRDVASSTLTTAAGTPAPRGDCMPRRDFLAKGGATIAFLAAFQLGSSRADAKRIGFEPFSYGVASGDPLPDRVIIWTRVNPSADATPGSGLGAPIRGIWEVSRNRHFTQRVATGPFFTSAATDHTVKIDVCNLCPATDYFYRFMVRGVKSPVGRMRTAPAAVASPSSVRFGLVSCSNFEAGYFTAYRHLAQRDDLDFILHVGDYIYEYANGEYGPEGFAGTVRAHDPAEEIISLADYRRRHACYKADADLRQLHARHPFITTWDDHETANNAWRDGAENHTEGTEGAWAERKAAGIKAYFEWMPIRTTPTTGEIGEVQPVYRKFSFGSLVDLFMLDLRQYRSEQPLSPADTAAINDPARTMLGTQQRAWLQGNLAASRARWKLMGNSVQIAPVVVVPSLLDQQTQFLLFQFFQIPLGTQGAVSLNTDAWDGYAQSRLEILGLISGQITGNPIPNCVFLTGDIHSTYAGDIPANPVGYNPATSLSLGTEFVCTSVTSDNVNEIVGVAERVPNGVGGYIDNPATASFEALIRGFNSWVRDVNLIYHGYSVVDVNSQRTQVDTWILRSDSSDLFAADPRIDPAATCIHRNSYQTLNLTQKVTPAAGPLGPRD